MRGITTDHDKPVSIDRRWMKPDALHFLLPAAGLVVIKEDFKRVKEEPHKDLF